MRSAYRPCSKPAPANVASPDAFQDPPPQVLNMIPLHQSPYSPADSSLGSAKARVDRMEDAKIDPTMTSGSVDEAAPSEPNYSFVNHSPNADHDEDHSQADGKQWPKQRRKRTSPEDQAVLEAAYRQDHKPDKAARQSIVDRVALTEKEVQIWFQNRRQSSRRKSRPLLPHEIIQYQLSRSNSSHAPDDPQTENAANQEMLDRSDLSVDDPCYEAPSLPGEASTITRTASYPDLAASALSRPSIVHSRPVEDNDAGSKLQALPQGYLSNRRSVQSLMQSQEDASWSQPASQSSFRTDADRKLKKSSSHVRLSMSFDGNASVVSGVSPSPPRAPPVDLMSSQSSAGTVDSALPRRSLQRSVSSRSRDSRAWEFWCDRDARNELGETAEKAESGSAADAIGLLRSTSGRTILGQVSSKRNSLLSHHSTTAKRTKMDPEARSLQRSSTSCGRLQHVDTRSAKSDRKPRPKLKYSESAVSVYIPGNDSDKENHSPERDRPSIRGGDDKEALKSVHKDTDAQSRIPRSMVLKRRNDDPDADPEVARFMRGGRKSSSISSEDDLDCIQGLLSLSQGNWR